MTAQTNIYGLLLPHLSVDLSDTVPITGWMISPDKGGAIHTSEVCDLAKPRPRR